MKSCIIDEIENGFLFGFEQKLVFCKDRNALLTQFNKVFGEPEALKNPPLPPEIKNDENKVFDSDAVEENIRRVLANLEKKSNKEEGEQYL